jgi:hypothetical protein
LERKQGVWHTLKGVTIHIQVLYELLGGNLLRDLRYLVVAEIYLLQVVAFPPVALHVDVLES